MKHLTLLLPLTLLPAAPLLGGCSAKDPPVQTPVFHTGTPTNRSSVNSWELNAEPANTQPGRYHGKPAPLKPIASQRGFEPDDPAAQAVLAALNADHSVSTQYLSASGKGGVVILIGSVSTEAQRLRAIQVARTAPGVTQLDSRVQVVRP